MNPRLEGVVGPRNPPLQVRQTAAEPDACSESAQADFAAERSDAIQARF